MAYTHLRDVTALLSCTKCHAGIPGTDKCIQSIPSHLSAPEIMIDVFIFCIQGTLPINAASSQQIALMNQQ